MPAHTVGLRTFLESLGMSDLSVSGSSSITLAESAVIAGLLKAPTRYAPTNDLALSRSRAAQVLQNMVEVGYITEQQAAAAQRSPAVPVSYREGQPRARYFVDWVHDLLPEWASRTNDDLIVFTTLDPAMQRSAEAAVRSALVREGKPRNVGQAALVAMDRFGAVKAMVGGKSYTDSQFNRAVQAQRQPGSAFKPFVYLTALEQGLMPWTRMEDAPIVVDGWQPRNVSGRYQGEVTLKRALSDSMRADPRVADVRSLVDLAPGTSILGYSLLYSDLDSARTTYREFLDAYLSRDQRVSLVDVIPADTTSLTSTMAVVARARALITDSTIRQLRGARVLVGGYVANAVDLQDEMLRRFPRLVALVLAATAIMLAIAFRSILVPLKAILMNSLSVSATFGLIVLVFQYGYGGRLFGLSGATEAIFVMVPVLVFAVVFGLSMDYEVFLLSRIKEAFDRTGRNTEATMEGLSATASVISSAALVMILVFGAFAFARVLVMQFLGFGLAVAVLLDATIIRMVLVPAFMHLMGRWNWWPGGRRRTGRTSSASETGRDLRSS